MRQCARERITRRFVTEKPPTQADARGVGVVVFDLETTDLIEDDVDIESMCVSVACALWLPHAATIEQAIADAEWGTFS